MFAKVLSVEFAKEEVNQVDQFDDQDLVLSLVGLTKSFQGSINETDVR